MPTDLTEQSIEYGKVHYEWDFPEYVQHERTIVWYVVAGLVVLGILTFSLVTANVLFAVLTVMAVIILVFMQQRDPRIMHIKIADEGLVIENRFFAYDEVKSFWVVYELPEIKQVYFEFKSPIVPRLSVPYFDIDPNKLKAFLAQYIDVDDEREGEPVSESIARLLRL